MELKNYFAQDTDGSIIPNAYVHVYLPGSQTLAAGLKRADGTDLENPFQSEANGHIQFSAPDGLYDLRLVGALRDYKISNIQFLDISAARDSANESASDAQSAKADAEAARDAAQLSAGIYATTSAGLSATTNGQYFSVPSADSREYLILYLNNSGAAVEQKRYPALGSDGKLRVDYIPLVVSANMFNKDTITARTKIDGGGVLTEDANFYVSDYMPAKAMKTYNWSHSGAAKYIAFYDINKTYLSRAAAVGTITTPANTAFVRVSPRYSETPPEAFMFVEGTELPAQYQPYAGYAFESKINRNAPSGYVGLDADGKFSSNLILDFNSPNLFNQDTALLNMALLSGSDGVATNTNFFTTDYIPVAPGLSYAFSTPAVAKLVSFYDSTKTFISQTASSGTFTAVENAHYVRISMRYSDVTVSAAMVVHGATLPETYQSFGGRSVERRGSKNVPGGYAGIGDDGKIPSSLIAFPSSSAPLSGKIVAGLGDSITYGFIPRNAPGYPGKLNSWLPLIATELGAKGHLNYGISGSTLGDNGTGANSPMTKRYGDMNDSADLIIVMGGTNDVRKGVPLGQFGDVNDLTFYGALYVLCEGLLNKYVYSPGTAVGKSKKILFMTAPKLGTTLDANLPAYNAATKEVCAHFSIPVFDAYNCSGLTPHLFRTLQGTEAGYTDLYNSYMTDGTHPTQDGHEMFAKNVAGFIRSLY